MPTNLTGQTIASTFSQLLHVDGGPSAAEKVVYSGTGVATALSVGTQSVSVDNIRLDGNTVSATTGDLTLGANIAFVNASNARSALALGTIATQDSDSVSVTGGTLSGMTSVASTTVTGTTTTNGGNLRLSGNVLSSTNTNGNITFTPNGNGEIQSSAKLGYAAGTGGTVTQATDKATGVTLNKLSGQITMDAAQLDRVTGVSFVLTNSFIAATDVVIVNIASGATNNAYTATIDAVAAGSCRIHLHNHLAATDLSEAVVLNFVVIKGVSA